MNVLYADGKIIAQYPNDNEEVRRTNCKNCGAPLPKHGRCMYCDTENGVIAKEEKNFRSSMSITAEGITVTCSEVMDEPFKQAIAIRDEQGRLHRREVVDLI